MATPSEKIELLRRKVSSIRPNLISHLMNRDGAAGKILQLVEVPTTGSPRLTPTDGKVVPPGGGTQPNAPTEPSSTGRRAPGPLASILSNLISPQPSEADLEAVRHAERQKVLNEIERETVARKQREKDEKRAALEKPAML